MKLGYIIAAVAALFAAPTLLNIAQIRGGTAGRLPYDNGTSQSYTSAPSTNTVPEWNGSGYTWVSPGGGSGTVTSVSLTAPSDFTVSGSPVTTSGTLGFAWNNESAHLILAGPSSGSAAAPTWRSLVVGDLPSLTSQGMSVGLTMPAIFSVSGSPVTSSGTLAATLTNQSANLIWAGPTSGGAAAPTFRSLVAADLGTGTASSSTFLRGDLTWATPTAGAAGSTGQVQYNNGSGALTADAGLVDNGVATSGALLAVAPTNAAATGVKVTSPASFTGNYFEGKDSGGNDDLRVFNDAAGGSGFYLFTQTTGSGVNAHINLGTNGYQINGGWVGAINFGDFVSGYNTGAMIYAPTAEAHGASAAGTSLFFKLTPKGTTTGVNRVDFDSQGNVITNASGSAVSTSSTDGFLYVPNMAGLPTGTPTPFMGNSPLVYDSTDGVLLAYNGSSWGDMSNGVVTTEAGNLTMATTTKIVKFTATIANGTLTLCSNANYAGRTVQIIFAHGASKVLTVQAGTGDTIYNGGTSGSLSLGASQTFTKSVSLTSTGDGNWYVTAGG